MKETTIIKPITKIGITSKSTTILLIIYRHFTRIKLRHLASEKIEGKLLNP